MNQTPLELHVLELTKKAIENDNGKVRSFGVHASTLSTPCMRNVWYQINGIPSEFDFKTKGSFKLGTAVHNEVILNKKANEIELFADIRNLKRVAKITEKNMFDCVIGKSDDFILWDQSMVILDKKTFSSKKYTPKQVDEGYVMQLNTYKLLHFIKTGVEVKSGCIVYLDVAERLSNILVFEVPLKPIPEIQKTLVDKLDLIKTDSPPDRVISWRCKGCPFNKEGICHPQSDPNYQRLVGP